VLKKSGFVQQTREGPPESPEPAAAMSHARQAGPVSGRLARLSRRFFRRRAPDVGALSRSILVSSGPYLTDIR